PQTSSFLLKPSTWIRSSTHDSGYHLMVLDRSGHHSGLGTPGPLTKPGLDS
ncbi:hypothetical protein CROQUDRAFT_666801, partial [Cronartium quercuum f. sp. fusiforme G11]